MVLTERELQRVIIARMEAISESCNSYHINHQSGVLRGLLWALRGEDRGNPETTADVFREIGYPVRGLGDHFHWADPDDPRSTEEQLAEACEFCEQRTPTP